MKQVNLISIEQALALSRNEVRQLHRNYVNPGLANMLNLLDFDKQFVRAAGVSVWDSQDAEYLDFLGGYGALNLGHNPPTVLAAVQKVDALPNILKVSLNALSGALAHNLAQLTPGNLFHTFFCNSGAEAVEGALKLARIATGRQRFVSCAGAFHGKSFGALSVTGREKYKEPFKPLLAGCTTVPYGDAQALEDALQSGDVAAFIVEPVQGEGGIILPPAGFLPTAAALCRRYGTLLIVDEVQTGLGRTGKMFACEHEGIVPDVLCLAKSLGGGVMPIGAFITTPELWQKAYGGMERCLLHTSTFGENTRAMAAALATIETIYAQDLLTRAAELGEYALGCLRQLQREHAFIKEVRGIGLLLGIEFTDVQGSFLDKLSGGTLSKLAQEYVGAMVAGELLNNYRIITAYTLNNPNVIRLEPPLIVTKAQIDRVVDALDAILRKRKGLLGLTVSASKVVVNKLFKKE